MSPIHGRPLRNVIDPLRVTGHLAIKLLTFLREPLELQVAEPRMAGRAFVQGRGFCVRTGP